MNKRADITVTILVIGVFMVCTIALISFFQTNVKIGNSFVGLDLMEKMNSDIEVSTSVQRLNLKNQPKVKTEGSLYYLEAEKKIKKGVWGFRKEKIVFYLRYTFKQKPF
jgi:hypothetical protein